MQAKSKWFWFFCSILTLVLIGTLSFAATENNTSGNTAQSKPPAQEANKTPDQSQEQDQNQAKSQAQDANAQIQSQTQPETEVKAGIGTEAETETKAQVQTEKKPIGDALLGQEKSQVCAACHGADGNSSIPTWPKIAGQLESYLIKELKEYRKADKGGRFDPVMSPLTQSLSDSDIADLAAYFSKQTETMGTTKADLLALGEKIYRAGNLETGVPPCTACHGPDGKGNGPATFPRLSGQFPEYTMDQLKKFRAKTRSDDPNGIMRDIAKKMTEEEMQAVSSYVSGLH